MPRHPKHYGGGVTGLVMCATSLLVRPTLAVLSAAMHRLEMRHKVITAGYPKNYVVIASKPIHSD